MTTASLTANNVAAMTPVIEIHRIGGALGTLDVSTTAINFANANFRHLINRRMRWSECEAFVREAIQQLTVKVNSRALGNRSMATTGNRSMATTVDELVNTVRRAANRRRSYYLVFDVLRAATEAVIYAAERCR